MEFSTDSTVPKEYLRGIGTPLEFWLVKAGCPWVDVLRSPKPYPTYIPSRKTSKHIIYQLSIPEPGMSGWLWLAGLFVHTETRSTTHHRDAFPVQRDRLACGADLIVVALRRELCELRCINRGVPVW